MGLDHTGINVPPSQFDACVAFYLAALAPLGYEKIKDFGVAVGLGEGGKPDFWVGSNEGAPEKQTVHIAFTAKDRATVTAFYDAALAAGGKDNGKPGLRPHYHANFFGAFVFDPVGNNIEAVIHKPEE